MILEDIGNETSESSVTLLEDINESRESLRCRIRAFLEENSVYNMMPNNSEVAIQLNSCP